MKKKTGLMDFIVYLSGTIFMLVSIIIATYKITQISFSNYKAVIIIIAVTFIYCFLVNRSKLFLLILPASCILLVPKRINIYVIKYVNIVISTWIEFYRSFITNQYIENKYGSYFIILMYILIIIFTVFLYYLTAVKRKTSVILILGSGLFTFYYLISEIDIFKECSIFLIFAMFLYAYDNYNKNREKWNQNGSVVKKRYAVKWFVMVIVLLAVSRYIITAFSYEVKPASFVWFEKNIVQRFEDIGGREDRTLSSGSYKMKFNLTKTGFQQNSQRLGGSVKIDDSVAFKMSGGSNVKELHMRGSIKDNYNGYIWKKTDTQTVKYKADDVIKSESHNIPFVYNSFTIEPVNVETSTVFNILYPNQIQNKWNYYFIDSDMEIYNPGTVRAGKSYKVEFKDFDVKAYNLSNEIASDYDDSMKKYLQVSSTVPERVYNLTNEITKKYGGNPYLVTASIEKYLKSNYPYSLNTSELPKGKDFVDYFLFTEKKGSCTYYATAMAVMCRIAGVPTRYVEGYSVPKNTSKGGYTEVTNARAHAWVEVYFKNAGWVTFDPTPGHESSVEDIKMTPQDNQQDNQQPDTNNTNNEQVKKNNQKDIDQEDTGQDISSGKQSKGLTPVVYPCIIIFLAVIILAVCKILDSIFMKGKRFISYSFYKIMLYGKLLYTPYNTGDTIREYLDKLKDSSNMDFDRYIILYEKALYSSQNSDPTELKQVYDSIYELRKKAVKERGKMKVFSLEFKWTYAYLFRFKRTQI